MVQLQIAGSIPVRGIGYILVLHIGGQIKHSAALRSAN